MSAVSGLVSYRFSQPRHICFKCLVWQNFQVYTLICYVSGRIKLESSEFDRGFGVYMTNSHRGCYEGNLFL